jgi:hypothetical protein
VNFEIARFICSLYYFSFFTGVMAARGILQNPAMFAGYDNTPLDCVKNWVYI